MKTIPIIQNIDRAISKRDYDAFGQDLLITSFFSTIQGEGPFTGYPAMFVRTAGCNYGAKDFHCSFCDTSFFFDQAAHYSPRTLLAAVLADPGYNSQQVLVITGGEPTLQHNLLDFIVLASAHFLDIQIETNGTQPKFYRDAVDRQMTSLFKSVVSPKAHVTQGYAHVPGDVMWWANCLKFVVTTNPDDQHHVVPDWALASKKTIFVSPMAVYLKPYSGEVSSIWDDGLIDKEATAANYHYAATYAMKHRLRLSLQTHLFLGLA